MIVYSVLLELTHRYNTFTPVERRIAHAIIEHPEKVVDMSVKEISILADTSEAAVVRLAKKIGLKGIKTLKVALAKELHTINSDKISTKVEWSDSSELIRDKVFNNAIQALSNTEKLLDIDCIEAASEAMVNAKKIIIFGLGGSSVVAQDLKLKLRRIDVNAELVQDNHSALTVLANMQEGDVAFFVSSSGRTKEIIEVMKFGNKQGVTLILMTQNIPSPARRLSTITIVMSEEEHNIKFATMTARIVQLVIIDTLFFTMCKLKGQEAVEKILAVNKAINK